MHGARYVLIMVNAPLDIGKGKLKYTTNGKQKYIGNGKQKCTIKGKLKYTIQSEQNFFFLETPVGFKKPYRRGNEKTKNVQTD